MIEHILLYRHEPVEVILIAYFVSSGYGPSR